MQNGVQKTLFSWSHAINCYKLYNRHSIYQDSKLLVPCCQLCWTGFNWFMGRFKRQSNMHSTVEVNPTLSDQGLQNWTGGTLNIIKLIGMNSRFAKNCKKAQEQKRLENWTILKNLTEKKISNSPMCLTQWPFDNCPGALGHLDISLVDDRYKKLVKICYLVRG